jgi:hypothetical protein
MRGVPLPRALAPAEVDALLTNRDRAIAGIRLKFGGQLYFISSLA